MTYISTEYPFRKTNKNPTYEDWINVLKIFNQANISNVTIEVVKYNISSVCECVGINRDHYVPYYSPRIHNPKKGYRRSSVEAAIRFRKEFGVSEQDINQEQLLKKLEENNDDTATSATTPKPTSRRARCGC